MSDLIRYDDARRALQSCIEPLQAKTLRDKAAALEAFARAAMDTDMLVMAGEIKLRAERRLGELLAEMPKSPGNRYGKTGSRGEPVSGDTPHGGSRGEPPQILADLGIDKKLAASAQKLAAIRVKEFESYIAECKLAGQPPKSAKVLFRGKTNRLAVHHSSASVEHYTPPALVERVRAVFGGHIDLDPCSNEGTPNVPAKAHYTRREDGLAQPWAGNVYCNPPYGGAVVEWVAKAVAEYQEGRTDAIILLLAARTDTAWFYALRDFPVCFLRGRLTFIGSGAGNPAPFPSMLLWISERSPEVFAATFADVGTSYMRLP